MSGWDTYYKVHAARKPREQTVRAAGFCAAKGQALDLGAGTLIESLFLLENGFKRVVAVDSSEQIRTFAEGIDSERLILKVSSYQDFDFQPDLYDLINAQYALPFHGPYKFKEFIESIKVSLKHRGVFVGQLFGVRDGWNTEEGRLAFQTEKEALELLKGLELIEFEEEEREAKTAGGEMKHWHVFHFIARKL